MSIFKGTLDPFVQQQLTLRSSIKNRIEKGDYPNHHLVWENSKTAFVRMTSAVDVIDSKLAKLLGVGMGNDMAKRHVLQGGELFYENGKFSLRRGLGDGGGAYGDTSNATRTGTGLNPMAGITGVNVQSKGAYGALRDVTVSFSCWNNQEMDRLSVLYGRPGYCVLVEWGWSIFIDNKNQSRTTTPNLYNILDKPLGKQQIFEDLYDANGYVERSSGNYDAHMGYIRNFSAKFNAQRGWDCTLTIVSLGEIIESLKMNYVSQLSRDTVLGFGQKTAGVPSKPNLLPNASYQPAETLYQDVINNGKPDSYFESKLAFIYDSILQQAGKSPEATSTGFKMIKIRGNFMNDPTDQLQNYSDYPVYVGKMLEKNRTTESSGAFAAYISMAEFLDIFNYSIIVHDQTNKPFVYLTAKDKKGDMLLCNAHYLQFSIDPRVCIIRPCENTELCPPEIRTSHPNLPTYFLNNGKYNMGFISNIYLNVQYLKNLIPNSKNQGGYVDVSTYFNLLFQAMNSSLGGINNFRLYPDSLSNRVYIADMNYLEDTPANKKTDDKFMIKIGTMDSIVREPMIETKIYPSQSQISAIAAQAGGGGGVVGIESFTYDMFNKGIQDRILQEKFEPKSKSVSDQDKKQAEKEQQKTWADFATRLSYIRSLLDQRGAFYPQNDLSEGLHRLILSETRLQLEKNNTVTLGSNGILPIILSFTTDGIAGLVVGQIFRVNDDAIPLAYRGLGNIKIGFIIKEVNHTISGGDWVTEVVTQTCVLDTIDKKLNPVKNEIFKEVKFTRKTSTVGQVLDVIDG